MSSTNDLPSPQKVDLYSADTILLTLKQNLPAWEQLNVDQITVTRLNGMSNACFKVAVNMNEEILPNCVLYRIFECELTDTPIETALFNTLSDQRIGPECYYVNSEYRIEEWIEGRALSIWELRSPFFMKLYLKNLSAFHFNAGAQEIYQKYVPLDIDLLTIDNWISTWGALVKKRIPHLRETLQADSLLTGKLHSDAFEAIDICEKNFLFEGYEEHFRAMIPREYGSVISHNDGQECNLLLSDKDNTKMIIIDYEYCGWNPPAYDIANYMNEMTFDNNPRFGKGCQYYQVNFPSDSAERQTIIKTYMEEMYNNKNKNKDSDSDSSEMPAFEVWYANEAAQFTKGVQQCMGLNNMIWSLWGLVMVPEKDICNDDKVFHYDFIRDRVTLYNYQKELGLY